MPVFGSLREGLRLGPDLVDVATPPDTHLDLVAESLAAGRPTVCQKPFAGGLEGAREAVRLAEAAGVPLVVHENVRFQPWYRAMRREIAAGRLGTVLQATFRLRPGDGQGPDAYLGRQPYFRTMPRLLVHETAVHWVDTFRYLLDGEPRRVFADLRRINPAVAGEDAGTVLMDFGEARALFDGNRHLDHAARDTRLTLGEALVEGTAATLALDGAARLSRRAHGETATAAIPLRLGEGFGAGCVGALQAHVVDHVLRGAPLENEARHYLANLEIVEAIYRSAAEGCWVPLTRS